MDEMEEMEVMTEWDRSVADLADEIYSVVVTVRNITLPPEVHASAALKLKKIRNDTTNFDLFLQALFGLVEKDDVIRRPALKMLRELIRNKWEAFSTSTRDEIIRNVPQLVRRSCHEWDTKTETAELMAEVARKKLCSPDGFDRLTSFVTTQEDEMLGMILKYLQDDITIDTDYLKGNSRTSLFDHLTQLAPNIINLLLSLFEKHAYDMNAPNVVQQPNAAMASILSALSGYAAWAPIEDVNWSRVICRCYIWLSTYKSVPACRLLKVITCQRELTDGTHGMVREFITVLLTISRGFTSGSEFQLKSDCEFTDCICDTMAALGCSKVHSVLDNKDWIQNYFQEMLHYYQHQRIELQAKSLSFWMVALQESRKTEKEKMIASYVPEHMYTQLLDISVKNMLKEGAVPCLWPSRPSNKGFQREIDFTDHPTKLLDLMESIASERPVIAAAFVVQRFSDMFPSVRQAEICPKDLQTIGNTLDCLERIVDGIFGDACWNNQNESSKNQIHSHFEDLLVEITGLELSETWAIELQGRFLSLFGLYCKNYPTEISSVVEKLLSILASLPAKDNLPSDSNEARFTICACLMNVSEVASDAFAPEKDRVTEILGRYQKEGMLLDGEHEDLRQGLGLLAVMHVD